MFELKFNTPDAKLPSLRGVQIPITLRVTQEVRALVSNVTPTCKSEL
jgi:hypothetical protein